MPKNKETAGKKSVCCFCKTDENDEFIYGKFYHLKSLSVHHNCMFFSSGLSQQGRNQREGILGFLLKDIEAELSRGRRLRCSYCKKTGATVGCSLAKCKKTFHFPCGLKNLSLHQYFGAFCSFCETHKPKQKEIEVQDEDLHCHICYTCVSHHELGSCLYPPCCKKNFFHR
ncbi:G2/M phase-specific E3 ubiquitin-protein ligase, partial [Stegodyphus mimosarum]